MTRFTIVHAADVHLDSPMRGLARYEGAPVEVMRTATRQALRNLVDLCRDEGAALLLLAGDVFDGDWRDYATGQCFVSELSRLREADVEVVMIRGNHDAASVIQKHLPLPANTRELSPRAPETVRFERLGVAVHGQSYAQPAVSADLAAGYPAPSPGWLDIGLLHTSLDGRPGHEPYAPCRPETLIEKGYAYWALGHVHRREVVHRDPWVVFPGNLQGRHIRETGAKGATVIHVEDGAIVEVVPRVLDVARWAHLEVDITAATSGYDVVHLVTSAAASARDEAEGRPLALRVTLEGRSRAHGAWVDDAEGWAAQLRAEFTDLGPLWLERVRVRSGTAPHDRLDPEEAIGTGDGALAQVMRGLDGIEDDDDATAALIPELLPLHQKIPRELKHTGRSEPFRLNDPEVVRELLPDVRVLLRERMLAADGAEEER
ncbi:MAG: DNA repair exonuclease [Myxococcota bacterium]